MDEYSVDLFTYVGPSLDLIVNEVMFPAVARVMDAIRPTVYWGLFIYIVMSIIAMFGRSGEQSVITMMFALIKIVVVVEIALTFTTYQTFIIDPIDNFQATMGSAVSDGGAAGSLYEVLDGLVAKGIGASSEAFEKAGDAGWRNAHIWFLWMCAGGLLALGGVIIAAAGACIIIAAKFTIMILIMLGPLYVAAALFPVTSKFTISWISSILTQCFIIIIATVIMSFAVLMFGNMLDRSSTGDGIKAPLFVIVVALGLVLVLKFIIKQSGTLSASLSGGLSTAVMTFREMKDEWNDTKRSVNPESVKPDMESGHPIRNTTLGHALRGNSPVNPAWWGHQKDMAFKNYGFKNKGKMSGR